ncbi:hypothetical protein [Nocardia wallacei]|uniref:hypothetical protein n=1 Tax=Nocardia wallacei TaxID=480035 RepID=UPI0024580BBE|nr:hypothetical protein [Nocardia wallacei]
MTTDEQPVTYQAVPQPVTEHPASQVAPVPFCDPPRPVPPRRAPADPEQEE